MAEFVHLHVHSEYSLLDGLSSCRELAERAVELGMPALALTDHGAMYGAVQFYKACRAAGIKPIIGMEAYVAPHGRREKDPQERKPYHLILLAQNEKGYRNLMRLATVAQLEGFYYKPRIDKDILAECADGLIVLSGCGTSEVPRLILEGQLDEARRVIAWCRDVFPGRYFLEIQDHDIPELAQVNRQMIALAREFDLPLVATNDVHYARREEAGIHDVLLCIQTGKTVTEPNRLRMDGDTYYMRDAGEMAALFPDVPEALTNTLRVAEMCDLKLEFGCYHLPIFHVPEGYDAQSYLRHLCEEGLQRRYAVVTPEIRQRLEHELDVIHRLGFDTYFLIVWDLCRFAREHDIWWNVRGSAAGSIVAYTLGITNLEPLQHGLIFERFLNLGRVTMPDIDLDFPDDQRDQLIRYTIEKYGQEQVAQIITFGTMGAKAAIRDVGRALDYPLAEVDRIARLVPFGPKVTLDQALAEVPELREAYENEEHVRRLVDTARGVEGNVRHASTHAAGVVVSDAPLVTYTPLNRPTSGGEGEIGVVTQYTMEELEELGLLKIDYLGLATLTIMRRACELIQQRHGVRLNLHNIPTEDPAIFDLLSRGDVMGVFQVEGAGMRRVLMKMQPRQFDHIVATISLFRPGPMEYIDDYIDRMHGRKPIEYRHPKLEPILKETFAIVVYQEQIIRILTDIAGYSASDADLVRRCASEDTLVVDANTGRLIKIRDVQPGMSVLALDDQYRVRPVEVTQKFDNGSKPLYRITTKSGRAIELTANHPLLTVHGWCPVSTLKVNDAIAVPWIVPAFGQRRPDPNEAKILAYLIGDGQCVQREGYPVARFYNSDPEILQDYMASARALGVRLKTYNHPKSNVVTVTSSGQDGQPNPLLALIREFDLAHQAHLKRIPNAVFEYDADSLALFIGTLWNTDGSIERTAISYGSSSQHLIEQLAHLLRRFGINAWQGEKATTHRPHYRLVIRDQEEIQRFAATFGPYLHSAKRQKLDRLLVQANQRTRNQSKYQIPAAVLALVHEAKVASGLSWREAEIEMGIKRGGLSSGLNFRTFNRALSRHRLDTLGRAFDSQHLCNLAQAQVLWDPIVSIEPAGEKRVYDLAVPPYANFIANDIVIHNSIGKKKKEELLRHRASFVEGAVKHGGLLQEIAADIFDDIEYFARYGFNKCLPGDTEIVDVASGHLVRIKDLFDGIAHVAQTITCDPHILKLQSGKVIGVASNGIKPVFRLTTALGRQIEATANHPFYTFDGWRCLGELKPGDRIAVPRQLPVEGQVEWPDYQVITLGHLIAEGNLCHPHSVYFYTRDDDLLADFTHAVEQFNNVQCTVSRRKGSYSVYARRICREEEPGIVLWLKGLGLWGKDAREKEIPAEVFTLTNRQIALLMSRLWEGAGHLSIRHSWAHAYYATASERLARQIQHLLLRLGIVSRLRKVNFPYRDGRVGYQVHVIGNEHIRRFADIVGRHFVNGRYREMCAYILDAQFGLARDTRDTIPVAIKSLVRAEKDKAGITWKQLREEAGVAQKEFYPTHTAAKKGFRRETLARLADYFDSDALWRYAASDVYWDEVMNIEYAGEKQTYDLTIDGTHNFIANDILVHNSHAADYAVLTCQTAYLKARYPVEYMTALLSVERNNTEKVGLLIAECRRMGIEVLPPDVNCSDLDFTIEEQPDGRPAIRFGLAAVKNVGEGAVEAILAARRAGGPFRDLDDFCRRVDVRQVNRRALECLIKVGALQPFGTRAQLLSVLDRIISLSANLHRAREMGQLSLFESTGASLATNALLPVSSPAPEVPQREILAWEKDLVGAYISEHPLAEALVRLQDVVTAYVGALDAEMNSQQVTVVGMVQRVRRHTTKKGDEMAFVTLEDLQGECDVVVFPRLWKQTRHLWQPERILVVGGKVDMGQRDEPSLLCDWAKTPEEVTVPAERDRPQAAMPTRPGPPQPPKVQPAPLPARTVCVTLARTGEQARDVQTLRRIHSLLAQRPGRDHFTIRLIGGTGKPVELAFPNDTTSYSPELAQELASIVGADAIQVVEGIR